jgi:hypothetical protein
LTVARNRSEARELRRLQRRYEFQNRDRSVRGYWRATAATPGIGYRALAAVAFCASAVLRGGWTVVAIMITAAIGLGYAVWRWWPSR